MKYIYNILIVATMIVGLSISASAQTADLQTSAEQVEKQTIKIKGATCKKDLNMILDNIKKIDGVQSCEVAKHGITSKVDVEYYPSQVSIDAIKSTILTTGTCEDPNARQYKVKVQKRKKKK